MEGKSSFAYAATAVLFCTALWHTTVAPVRAQLADSDWPMFQHDERHTGQSASNGPSTGTVRIKWGHQFNAIVRTSPAIGAGGTIYIGVGNSPICALHPNGSVEWCTNEPDYVVTPLMSSPAVDLAGRIYMGERGNDTWAVAPDGDVLWRFSIPYDGDTLSSPAIDPVNGRIYTACCCVGNGTLYALDPAGFEQCHFKVGASIPGPSPAIGPDGTIYIISGPGLLHALTPGAQGASRKWPAVNIGGNTKYGSPAIGDDGTIDAPSMSGIKAIDPDDGHKLWAFSTQGGSTLHRVSLPPTERFSSGRQPDVSTPSIPMVRKSGRCVGWAESFTPARRLAPTALAIRRRRTGGPMPFARRTAPSSGRKRSGRWSGRLRPSARAIR
jgi:outer membrane protein assembly factor BamB